MSEATVQNTARPQVWFIVLFLLIVLLGLDVRTFQIETRPLHSDEAVNFLFYERVHSIGYYPYSHENYHGPLFFYLITAFINLMGDSVGALRTCSVLSGLLLLFLPLCFRKSEGNTFCLLASLLLALSPSLIFYSRYAIHEPLLILATFLLATSLYHWEQSHRAFHFYVSAFALAILITTKETFAVAIFCIGLGFLSLGNFRTHWQYLRMSAKPIFGAALLLVTLVLATFSALFRWGSGIREMVLAIPQWLGRSSSDVGHVKPFRYYLESVLLVTEPALLMVIGLGLLVALVAWCSEKKLPPSLNPKRPLYRVLYIWTFSAFLVYSFIPYKTVWLIINITLPAVLTAAAVLSGLLDAGGKIRLFGILIAFVTVDWQTALAMKYNFVELPIPGTHYALKDPQPYGPKNPFSYVHTSPPMLTLVNDIENYWMSKPNARILVGVEGYFPLPYYLRHIQSQIAYTKIQDLGKALNEYDILILDHYKFADDAVGFDKKYYRLSDYCESNTFFRKLPQPQSSSEPLPNHS